MEYCKKFKCGKTVYPEKGETTYFKNDERMHKVPFVIYADFESILKPIDKKIGKNMKQFQKHEPSGYSYLVKCFDDNIFEPKLKHYTKKSDDENIGLRFKESLEKEVKEIYKEFEFQKRF